MGRFGERRLIAPVSPDAVPGHHLGTHMSLSDFFESMNSPVDTCINAIKNGETDKLKDNEVESFVTEVLSPLKAKIDEILAKPRNAKILECKAVYPSKEELESIDFSTLGDEESYRIMGLAMAKHTGIGNDFIRSKKPINIINRFYKADPGLLKEAILAYLSTPMSRRHEAWLHDAIGVGIFSFDGGKKVRRLPRKEAAAAAAKWLLSKIENPDDDDKESGALTIEVSDEEIAEYKKPD